MSDSTSGVICDVCGLYDARVFDPCGAAWCRVCDLLGLGDLAVREKVDDQAEAMGKLFDRTALFDTSTALGAKLDEALREALTQPIDTSALYGSVPPRVDYCCGGGANPGGHEWNCRVLKGAESNAGTDAGDPDTWGEPFVPDYAAINRKWREQMGEAAAHVPAAVEAVDKINARLKMADDGVRPDFMGMLQQVLVDADVTMQARTFLPSEAPEKPWAPGPLYTIPEPAQVFPSVTVPGIVDTLDEAHRGFIWKDTQGARWGWTKTNGWVAWNGGVSPYARGAVGPFTFDGPNLCDENGMPPDLPEWIKRMQAETDRRVDEFVEELDESNVDEAAAATREAFDRGEALADWELELIGETVLPADDDMVEHPSHYTSSKAHCKGCGRQIECIDVVEHMGYSLGNVTKYVWRCDLKHDAIEDLRKARQYLDFEIAKRERALVDDFKNRNNTKG
ncbi:hypothetical protein SEA_TRIBLETROUBLE_51 [Mycobacterium Phage TribleTrouble]|nr:hypothetical protein SEA_TRIBLETROUBLE_51 [Mycobacterium Phage TribleTrouble]